MAASVGTAVSVATAGFASARAGDVSVFSAIAAGFSAAAAGADWITVSGSSSSTVAPFIGLFEYVTRPLSSTCL